MKNYWTLLNQIIELLENFENQRGIKEISLENFILWANQQLFFKERVITHKRPDGEEYQVQHGHKSNVKLAQLLHELSKHFKLYSKKVLLDSDLVSMDGHNFLSMLYHCDSMRKIELIKANYMETPSGIEVIKRLLNKGFIEEFDDPDDKRSKRVKVTDKGKKEYQETIPYILKVIKTLAGNMSDEKKMELVTLLDELNAFHINLHEKAKTMTLDELQEKSKT